MSFALLCMMSIAMLSAQGVEEVTLVVSGDGATKEEATHVALRSAIEQAFGCFVSANTEILNDSLVKDEIVTITSGSISSYDELNVTELNSALISVTLRATVSVNKLISYAKSKGSSCELSGALLTQEKRMLEMNIANTKKALNHLFTLVNEFVEKNDIWTYSLDIENVKMNGYMTGKVTCVLNENGKNLLKMINDYIAALSIDDQQVAHLQEIGARMSQIECMFEKYRTYADFSCIDPELRESVQKNIDKRACVLLTDNLGFVYPEIPRIWPTLFFRSDGIAIYIRNTTDMHNDWSYSDLSFSPRRNILTKQVVTINLQIPEQNMAALTNIEIVPSSDPRFGDLHASLMNQAFQYYKQHKAEMTWQTSIEEDYYFYDKIGLYFALLERGFNRYGQTKEFLEEYKQKLEHQENQWLLFVMAEKCPGNYTNEGALSILTEVEKLLFQVEGNFISGGNTKEDIFFARRKELSFPCQDGYREYSFYPYSDKSWEPRWSKHKSYFEGRSIITE